MADPSQMRLYDPQGQRLYLNASERRRFLAAALRERDAVASLCLCLLHTGCRVSEALDLRPSQLQREEGIIAIRSLKKRRTGHMRELPIPPELVERLAAMSHIDRMFWPIGRSTAWRQVKAVMAGARIEGPQATAKGLRHGFAVHAVMQGVPPMILQKWMGTRICV